MQTKKLVKSVLNFFIFPLKLYKEQKRKKKETITHLKKMRICDGHLIPYIFPAHKVFTR